MRIEPSVRRAVALGVAAALALAGCAHRRADPRALEALAAGGMVELRGGTFLLAERTGPALDVVAYERVGTFLLDVREVTVAAYARCVEAGACEPAGTRVSTSGLDAAGRATWARLCNGDRAERAEHPVNCVDFEQASRYCAWAGKRLPTEAEWEWAARNGGAGTTYPWGDEPPADRACWSGPGNEDGRRGAGTCPAGSHPTDATRAGVLDLGGSVWEWTDSRQALGADSRGRGGTEGRIVRGGSWWDDEPAALLVWRRRGQVASLRDARLGFRCASDR